jgi:hypothetical protein
MFLRQNSYIGKVTCKIDKKICFMAPVPVKNIIIMIIHIPIFILYLIILI